MPRDHVKTNPDRWRQIVAEAEALPQAEPTLEHAEAVLEVIKAGWMEQSSQAR